MAKAQDEYIIKFGVEGRDQVGKLTGELAQLNKQLREKVKQVEKGKGVDAASRKQIGRLKEDIDKTKKSLKLQTEALKTNTTATKTHTQAVQKSTSVSKKRDASLMSGIKNFAKMAAAITATVAVVRRLISFISESVKTFAQFELGVKNVTTLMSSDDTGLFRGDLFAGSIQLSQDFGFALKDVNTAMFNAVSAGIAGGDAITFLNEASELAIAGVTNLKSATMGLTTVLNAYSMESSEASKVADILFTTQKFGVTTVEELSKSLGVVVPFAAASGISLEELGSAIAVTTRSGLDAAKTVTALRAAISQMQKPAAESRDLFIQYGIPIGAAQMKSVGFTETLRRLNKVFKENPRAIEQMFGNVRGLTAIFSLAGENAEDYNTILEENQDETLRAANRQKALEENMDSSQIAIDKLKASYELLKVSIGDTEFFQGFVEDATSFLDILAAEELSFFEKLYVGEEGKRKTLEQIKRRRKIESDKDTRKAIEDGVADIELIRTKIAEGAKLTPEEQKQFEALLSLVPKLEQTTPEGNKFFMSQDKELKTIFDEFTAHNKKIQDENKRLEEADKKEKNRRADLSMEFNEIERQGRLDLSTKIKELNEKDSTDGQIRAVTDLAIIESKLKREQELLKAYHDKEIVDENQRVAIQGRIDKLITQRNAKQLEIRNTNSESYVRKRTMLDEEFFEASTDAAIEQAETRALTKKQFNIQEIEREILHVDTLLAIHGSTEAERNKLLKRRKNLQIRLAKEENSFTKKNNDDIVKISKDAIKIIADARREALKREMENFERQMSRRKEMLQQEQDDGLINQRQAANEKEQLEKESFEKRKQYELKLAKINFVQELANIAVQAAANPAAAFTFGTASIAQYKILSALAIARYATNVSSIQAQQFAKGGLVHGKPHNQGGEKFAAGGRVVELEGGEAVINKRSTSMFGGALSAINKAGGGTSFSSPNIKGGSIIDYEALGSVIARNTNVVLPVESLNKTQNRVKMIEKNAKF